MKMTSWNIWKSSRSSQKGSIEILKNKNQSLQIRDRLISFKNHIKIIALNWEILRMTVRYKQILLLLRTMMKNLKDIKPKLRIKVAPLKDIILNQSSVSIMQTTTQRHLKCKIRIKTNSLLHSNTILWIAFLKAKIKSEHKHLNS